MRLPSAPRICSLFSYNLPPCSPGAQTRTRQGDSGHLRGLPFDGREENIFIQSSGLRAHVDCRPIDKTNALSGLHQDDYTRGVNPITQAQRVGQNRSIASGREQASKLLPCDCRARGPACSVDPLALVRSDACCGKHSPKRLGTSHVRHSSSGITIMNQFRIKTNPNAALS